jgi:ABC-2 type transport system permease protein
MKNLKHIWFIAVKDLKIFVSDRWSLFFAIIFPFLFIVLFNFLLTGAFGTDTRLTLHVTTQENGGMSTQILASLETKDEAALAPGAPNIIWDKDYAAAKAAVDSGNMTGFLAFPADFTQAVMAGTPTSLEVYADAGATNDRAALNGLASAITSRFVTDAVIVHATAQLMMENSASQAEVQAAIGKITAALFAGGDANAETPFLTLVTEKVGDVQTENPSNYVVPGYLVMFVFFAAAASAPAIVQERERHTLERLLTTSTTREAILGGVYLGGVIKGLMQSVIFWGFGILVFHVDMGLSPSAVILLTVLLVLMSAAFTVMLATLAKTVRSASSLAVLASLLLAALGGCWWPLFLYPPWLQTIAKISPHAWATEGFNKLMLFGAGFSDAGTSMIALAVFAVIFGSIAIWRFKTSAN